MKKSFPALALGAMLLAACQTAPATEGGASSSSLMSESASATDTVPGSTFTRSSVTIDKASSTVTFVGGSSIVDHPGSFETFDVQFTLDTTEPQNLEKARIAATIDIASVTTDSKGLDGHFQREDFFNAAAFPQATFRSTSITHKDSDNYTVTGDLTMKGVTKSISMDAIITDTGMSASFEIPRKDFGIAKDTYGEKLLDEAVPVQVELSFN